MALERRRWRRCKERNSQQKVVAKIRKMIISKMRRKPDIREKEENFGAVAAEEIDAEFADVVEDAAAFAHGVDDAGEVVVGQDDIGGLLRDLGPA
jgi:hypothetical protein